MNIRTAAARVIYNVFQGQSLSDCLPRMQANIKEPRDQALLQALCYGICRRYYYLEGVIDLLLETPLKDKDTDIYALLLVGLYQLSDMRIPPHAAVSETVTAVEDFKKPWAKGLVNAVLRNFQRQQAEIEKELTTTATYAHPEWFIGKVKKAWPQEWEAILAANNQHPPFALRINESFISREEYLKKLEDAEYTLIPETKAGIVLTKAVDVDELPGFRAGEISVQDGAAQLASELMDLQAGQRVLDACAAPGGKTAHMLEMQPKLEELVAIDIDEERLSSVAENLERLQLTATCIVADAANPDKWWDKKPYDRILIDAPCSATGVIRRHPDIKLLRHPDDIEPLTREQTRLLNALWPLLKEDGMLVYATCSVFPQENHKILQAFLEAHPDAKEEKITGDWGINCTVGKQILPGMYGMDGFYYARLRKCRKA